MKKYYLFLLLLSLGLKTFAQNTLNELYATQPIEVIKPFEVDTVNQRNRKFDDENLLKLNLTIPEQTAFTKVYQADTAGFFILDTFDGKPFVQLFSFYVQSDDFGKADVMVVSPNMLEIYIDDRLISTKRSKEDSLHLAHELSAELSPYPRNARVVIKLLCDAKQDGVLKITVKKRAKDSSAGSELVISNQAKRKIVLDDMILGKRVMDINVSPQGNYALINYSENYGTTSTVFTELYTVKTGRRVMIDQGRQKTQLHWMPKTEQLYFVQRKGRQTNLMTMNPETMEEYVLFNNIPNEQIVFSPDEKAFFYSKAEESARNNDVVFRMQTLTDRTGGITPVSLIYRFDLANGLTRQVTFGSQSTTLHDISRDGKLILFSTSEDFITERPFWNSSLFCLHLETMQVDTLWIDDKYASSACFSTDTKSILITGAPESFEGIGMNINEEQTVNSYDIQAFIMDLSTREIEPITKDFNPSILQSDWHSDGLIYFRVNDEDRITIYSYHPTNRKFTKLPLPEDVISQCNIADFASIIGYTGMSVSNSSRAYLFNLKDQKNTLVADPYHDQLTQLSLGEVKDFNFINSEGTDIKGYYYLPPNFDPDKKYPMIVYYYGGTTPTERRFESRYPLHIYAALGYVIYVLHPSGAIGFGQKFSAWHVNTWGIRSSDDIIEGTKQFIQDHSFVDEKKIGCIGASYGGFMTMYLQTKTDLFASAVSHAGISSISSYWGEGYWGYSYSGAASADSYPWNNYDLYVGQSPLFNADKINTPLLLLHGTADTNVPPGESIQMYTALKILGKQVELIQVRGEDHQIVTYDRRLKWNESIFAWFEKWLKEDATWWDSLYKGDF